MPYRSAMGPDELLLVFKIEKIPSNRRIRRTDELSEFGNIRTSLFFQIREYLLSSRFDRISLSHNESMDDSVLLVNFIQL
jgi:hypothetical protein